MGEPGSVLDKIGRLIQPSPIHQYRAVSEGAAIIDRSNRGRVEILGKDRQKLLHNLCTNDILQLASGDGCEAFFLDSKGKILEYATVYQLPEQTWLDVESGRAAGIIQHLDKYVIREDVRFHDRTDDYFQWVVTGPKAAEVVRGMGVSTDLTSLKSPGVAMVDLDGAKFQLRRRDVSRFPGYEFVGPRTAAEGLSEKLLAAGKLFSLTRIANATAEILRIEAGLPMMGREITSENLAQEIGRDAMAISFKKGCYLGQETVARLDAMGHVNKLLRGILMTEDATPKPGAVVRLGDKEVGRLTSWARSPGLGRPIALAVLRTAACKKGTKLRVDVESGNSDAVTTDLPFATA